MPRTSLPSYRHHRPSGQAVVTLSGEDVYLGRHNSRASRAEYDRLIGEWLAAGRTLPRRGRADTLAVTELVNAFRKSGVCPSSQADAYKAVMGLLVRLYGRTPVSNFGPLALRAVREQMIPLGWKRKTINYRVHCIRRIFRWGVAHEMVRPDVLHALEAVEGLRAGRCKAPESQPIQPVAVGHVETCLPFMPPIIQTMVRLQLYTGMRAGEVCAMRTGDIDVTGPVWVYRPPSHKTAHRGKVREVAIGPKAQELLEPYLRPDLAAFIFSPQRAEQERREAAHAARVTPANCGNVPGSNRVRCPRKTPGDHYDTPSYRQAIDYAIEAAFPVPEPLARKRGENSTVWKARLGERWAEVIAWRRQHHWHPHQLRHSFADQVRRQFGLEHTQRALGHAHAAVTEIYAGVALEKAVEVAAAIG
jgi:integrase